MKNKYNLGFLLVFLFAQLQAQVLNPNVIENGDFTKGKAGWETRGRIVKLKEGKEALDGNPALVIELDNKKEQSLSILFKLPRDTRFISVRFKVRTSDDFVMQASQPLAITLWGGNSHHDGIIHHEDLERSVEWSEKKAATDVLSGKVGMEIVLQPGHGKVYFDDFVAEAKAN